MCIKLHNSYTVMIAKSFTFAWKLLRAEASGTAVS
jgi:hypothetical protein